MDAKNPYAGINFEEVDFDKVREMRMEQQLAGYPYLTNGYYEPYPGYYAERFNAFRSEMLSENQVGVIESKPYSEMSMEELKDALSFAEMDVRRERQFLDKQYLFSDAYWAQKADLNDAKDRVNAIKSEIFGRNQEASLSRLNEKSLAALEDYYRFDCESHIRLSAFGIGMDIAEQLKLKNNVVNALEEQGISGEEFAATYEYYRFQRDAECAEAIKAETEAAYENGNIVEKVGMNAETVLTAPIRGVVATPEMIRSLVYVDPYAPLNVNSPAFAMINDADTVRAATMKDIDSGAGKVAYQVAMNVADAAAITVVTGGTGYAAIPSVANASTSSAKTATENGASKEQALMMGLTSGATEMLTGKIPVDKIPFLQGDDLLSQSIRKGLEQVSGTSANAYLDSCINGSNSQFNQRVEVYITKDGLSQEAAQKRALLDVLKEMGVSFLGGSVTNVTSNVNVKIDLDAPKIDMSIAPYTVRVNCNMEMTATNTAKQQQNDVERTR